MKNTKFTDDVNEFIIQYLMKGLIRNNFNVLALSKEVGVNRRTVMSYLGRNRKQRLALIKDRQEELEDAL